MNVDVSIGGVISPIAGSLYFNNHVLTIGEKVDLAYINVAAFSVTALSELIINGNSAVGNKLYFDAAGNTLHKLAITLNGTGILGNALNIAAGTYTSSGVLTANGLLTTNGFLTLKSDANGDGRIGESSGKIEGEVTVERYIPAIRAWRFLTVPYDSTNQSIHTAWQEGNTLTTSRCPVSDPTPPGLGTQITGVGNVAGSGYDFHSTNSPSIRYWDHTSWQTPSSSLTTKLTDHLSWYIFIRGDRHICLFDGPQPANATTLRSKGTLNQKGGINAVQRNINGAAAGEFF